MTTHLNGFICLPVVYEHKGWTWEDSMHSGPWPLRKDGEPRARAGRVFWRVWSEWYAHLSDDALKRAAVVVDDELGPGKKTGE